MGSSSSFEDDPIEFARRMYNAETRETESNNQNSKRGKRGYGKPSKSHWEKTNIEPATSQSLAVADHWIRSGEDLGYDFPFNSAWLSHVIHDRVGQDPLFVKILLSPAPGKADILAHKMVDLFWLEYADETTMNSNAISQFLRDYWDDIRDYSVSCLTAAKTKADNRVVRPPTYEKKDDQQMHKTLTKIRVEELLGDDAPLVSGRRPVLRSARHKLRRHTNGNGN